MGVYIDHLSDKLYSMHPHIGLIYSLNVFCRLGLQTHSPIHIYQDSWDTKDHLQLLVGARRLLVRIVLDVVRRVEWCVRRHAGATDHGVRRLGEKDPNDFDLSDMSGNVAEWVWDVWVQDAYKRHKDVDPIFDLANPAVDGSFSTDMYVEGNARHYRGGNFRGFNIKVYERSQNVAHYYGRFVGFRLVRTSP